MPYSTTYHAGAHLIIITYQAVFEPAMVGKLISEVVALAKQHDCFHILEDFREARLGFSTLDLYNVPKLLSEKLPAAELEPHQFKRALVASHDWKDFSFFETVSVNRGQSIKVFRDMEAAVEWLSEV